MKIYKKILIFLLLVFTFFSCYSLINTYAKYLTSTSGNANIPIAKWNITVNDISVKDDTNLSATISPIFLGNDNIAENIIAPTSEGYFDLDFDFAVDVSFSYLVEVSVNEDSPVSDLIVTGYSIDDGPIITFDDTIGITDTIRLADKIDSRSIRIYIVWDDSSDASMDNIADTLATNATNQNALLDVVVSFTQITN